MRRLPPERAETGIGRWEVSPPADFSIRPDPPPPSLGWASSLEKMLAKLCLVARFLRPQGVGT